MSDQTAIQKSLNDSINEQNVEKKYYLDIPDSNSNIYNSSQIKISTAQLTSSPDFFSASESDFLIPYTIKVSSSQVVTNGELMATLKNSCMDVINGIQIRLNNDTVVDLCNMSNVYYNWKLVTETSSTSLPFMENKYILAKNDGNLTYQGAASAEGIGESMSKTSNKLDNLGVAVTDALSSVYATSNCNTGYVKRANVTGFNPAETTNALYTSIANCDATRTSYYAVSGNDRYFHIFLQIPLIQFDFFKKLPLVRSAMFNIDIQCHSVTDITIANTFTVASAGVNIASNTFAAPSVVSTQYAFNPVLLGDDTVSKSTVTGTLTISCGIGGVTGTVSPFQAKCYLRACMYKLETGFEQIYSNLSKKHLIMIMLECNHFMLNLLLILIL